jgi:predicted component of type VI protein secretion system
MATLTDFQSFSPVTQAGAVPSLELALWMREVVTILREVQAKQADLELRIEALEP